MICEVLDVMLNLAKEGMTMLVVSHEIGFIREASTRVLVLVDGMIIEEGTPEQVFKKPTACPHTGLPWKNIISRYLTTKNYQFEVRYE